MVQANPLGPTATDVEEDYDPGLIREIIEFVRFLQENTYSKTQNVEVVGQPDSAGRRQHLVLRSPDGNSWRVLVDNVGVLSTELVPFDPGVAPPTVFL
jgi:hypothetical protein